MTDWISVKDRMPEKAGLYLIREVSSWRKGFICHYDLRCFFCGHFMNEGENQIYAPETPSEILITHWYPLPEMPEIWGKWKGRRE